MRVGARRTLGAARRLVGGLVGPSGTELLGILIEHLRSVEEAVELARGATSGGLDAAAVAARMESVEHRGDLQRRNLVAALAACVVPPLDREDVFRLSRAIDDVLDNVRDFAREWALYRPEDGRRLSPLLDALAGGLGQLRSAVGALCDDPAGAAPHLLAAKHRANEVRRGFGQQVAELFEGGPSSETLKQRELLRRLDVVGIRLGEAVDILFDALVKRGSGLSPGSP